MTRHAALVLAAGLLVAAPAAAQRRLVDRAVVRFVAPETGGVQSPRFVFERELAFEARLEALADPDHRRSDEGKPYRPRHIRGALQRHIAETLLESLEIDPAPTDRELAGRIEEARLTLYERVGGVQALQEAARAEGIDASELLRMLRRQARASLYLDRMVAPMLDPSDAELRRLHRTARTPFSGRSYDEIEPELRRWYVGLRLTSALRSFHDNARSRMKVTWLSGGMLTTSR